MRVNFYHKGKRIGFSIPDESSEDQIESAKQEVIESFERQELFDSSEEVVKLEYYYRELIRDVQKALDSKTLSDAVVILDLAMCRVKSKYK